MFRPRLALASLSGRSDADWAANAVPHAGAAFLGGIAIDEPTRDAARTMVERDRTEFLPPDPLAFIQRQLEALTDVPVRPGINVRSASPSPLEAVGHCCRDHDALLEVNAHCRQAEMCAVGSGESLLGDIDRLVSHVETAHETGATVGVKVRAEVDDVDLPRVCRRIEAAGASFVHVDAMDSEPVIEPIATETDLFVIANNGVRDRETVQQYRTYGADAVSVGRPSDEPRVLERVAAALAGPTARRQQ